MAAARGVDADSDRHARDGALGGGGMTVICMNSGLYPIILRALSGSRHGSLDTLTRQQMQDVAMIAAHAVGGDDARMKPIAVYFPANGDSKVIYTPEQLAYWQPRAGTSVWGGSLMMCDANGVLP